MDDTDLPPDPLLVQLAETFARRSSLATARVDSLDVHERAAPTTLAWGRTYLPQPFRQAAVRDARMAGRAARPISHRARLAS